MRKLIMAAATAAALAAPSSALANASSIGGGTTANAVGTVQGGKNNQTQQYKRSYTDSLWGPVICTGVHQSGKSYSALGQDSFTCTSTSGQPLTNLTPGQTVGLSYWASFGDVWFSDYYSLLGQGRIAQSISGVVSSDGMSVRVVAGF